jgi:predicted transcriptional regulator
VIARGRRPHSKERITGSRLVRRPPLDLPASVGARWWYIGSMKVKTSVTLSEDLVRAIDRLSRNGNRSAFIEAAIEEYIAVLSRRARDERDLEILNRHADALNEEARDVLSYQVEL